MTGSNSFFARRWVKRIFIAVMALLIVVAVSPTFAEYAAGSDGAVVEALLLAAADK